jgi:hypothetical protein
MRTTKQLPHQNGISRRSVLLGFAGTTFAGLALAQYTGAQAQTQTTPLASWSDGPAKQAVLDFVRATTDHTSKDFVVATDRIATFDQDGTLCWCGRPPTASIVPE